MVDESESFARKWVGFDSPRARDIQNYRNLECPCGNCWHCYGQGPLRPIIRQHTRHTRHSRPSRSSFFVLKNYTLNFKKTTLFVWRSCKLLFHFFSNSNELMNLKVLPLHSSHFLLIWFSNFYNIRFPHFLWSFFCCTPPLFSNQSFFSYFFLAFKNSNFNSGKRRMN